MKYKNSAFKRILAFCMVFLLCIGASPTAMAADAPASVSWEEELPPSGDIIGDLIIIQPPIPEGLQTLILLFSPLLALIDAVFWVITSVQSFFEWLFCRG
ncbi:MAG: hypothetical protein ACI4I5_05295 [Acutalibacteraceae bacterium]